MKLNNQIIEKYFDLMTMNAGSMVFHTALKLDIIGELLKKEHSLQSLAVKKGLKKEPLRVMLESLCALDIVRKNGDLYKGSEVLNLLTGDYRNLSNSYWEHLPILLKTGELYKKMDCYTAEGSEYTQQVKSLEWMMTLPAEKASDILRNKGLLQKINILDVGAGAGVWSYAMLRDNHKNRASLVDHPSVLKIAEKSAKKQCISDQVKYIEGDYHKVEFGGLYDIAILGNVTHLENPADNVSLMQKIYQSLKENGKLIIFDVTDKQEKGRLPKLFYELGLLLRTENGKVYKVNELVSFGRKAGFLSGEFIPLKVTPYTMGMIILAKK